MKLTPSEVSHLRRLMPPRVSARETGSAGLREGLQGVVVVTIRDRGTTWPKAELGDSL